MPGGRSSRVAGEPVPPNETALETKTMREIKRTYGPDTWALPNTTRLASAGRYGIPDRLIIIRGHPFVFEFKSPAAKPHKQQPTPRQAAELAAASRAGATSMVITSVRQALDTITATLDQDNQ